MAAKKKLSILDRIAASEDVAEALVNVPEWGEDILFRGISYAALQVMQSQGVQIAEAQGGDPEQIIRLLQITACDPDTKQPIFIGDHGADVLRARDGSLLIRLLEEGALVVLGVDEKDTAGKDLSSTATETPALDASSSGSPEN